MDGFYFKGVKISCCNIRTSVEYMIEHLNHDKPDFICVTDSGNIVNAIRKSPGLKSAINNSLLSLPDGKPVSEFAKLKGIKNIERVAGPDFMDEAFKRTSGTGIKHFFLGDTDEIHSDLKNILNKKYEIQISGSYSPPFGEWDEMENIRITEKINSSGADLIWVSFGGGKQEIWMNNNYKKLMKGVMVGAGAAFRFYTGDIKRAPVFMQKAGLEWFYRLLQQPGKMFFRYLSTLPFFIIYSFQEYFKELHLINNNQQ